MATSQTNFYPAGMIGKGKPRAETNPSEIKEQSTSEEVATSAPKKLAPRLIATDERMRRLYDLKPRPNQITPSSKPLVNRKQKARFRSKDQLADSPYMKPEKVPAAAAVTTNKKNTAIIQHRRQATRRPLHAGQKHLRTEASVGDSSRASKSRELRMRRVGGGFIFLSDDSSKERITEKKVIFTDYEEIKKQE